jgi:hypothetical protein
VALFKDYNFGAPKYFNGHSATIFVSSQKFVGQEDLNGREIIYQLF